MRPGGGGWTAPGAADLTGPDDGRDVGLVGQVPAFAGLVHADRAVAFGAGAAGLGAGGAAADADRLRLAGVVVGAPHDQRPHAHPGLLGGGGDQIPQHSRRGPNLRGSHAAPPAERETGAGTAGNTRPPGATAGAAPVTKASSCLDGLVGDPSGADAQGFADAFAEQVADPGFGFADAVGPRAAVVGLIAQHHRHVGLGGDAQADAAGEQFPDRDGVLGGFLHVAADGVAQRPALGGQQGDPVDDGFAGLAVADVADQGADLVELQQLHRMLARDRARCGASGELGLAGLHALDQVVQQRERVLAGDGVAVEDPPPVGQFHALGVDPGDPHEAVADRGGDGDDRGTSRREFFPAPVAPASRVCPPASDWQPVAAVLGAPRPHLAQVDVLPAHVDEVGEGVGRR